MVNSTLTTNFKLIDKDCPSSNKEIEEMDRIQYASAIGSLMYAIEFLTVFCYIGIPNF